MLRHLQVFGVLSKVWLQLAPSMAEESGSSVVEEASLLEEEVIDKSCATMVVTF